MKVNLIKIISMATLTLCTLFASSAFACGCGCGGGNDEKSFTLASNEGSDGPIIVDDSNENIYIG